MSERTETVMFCDVCNTGQDPASTCPHGVYYGTREDALEAGWARVGSFDWCIECQDRQQELIEDAKVSR